MSAKFKHEGLDSASSRPSTRETVASSESEVVQGYDDAKPTASHVLAGESIQTDAGDRGASQVAHEEVEVKDLGWNDEKVPQHVVGGLKNEELWAMLRRFNKQVFHVKSIDQHQPPLADLDLNVADDEFSPEKLQAQLERLYMVVIISLISAWKHVVRLRSWREHQRTSAFLAVYSIAWVFDMLVPTITAFLMVLILYRPARAVCFPSAPILLVNPKTGRIQKPAIGVLASGDSLTGAPEKHQGEALEQEAHSFVTSISTLVIRTAAGGVPQGDPYEDSTIPHATEGTADIAHGRDKTNVGDRVVENDRAREPVSRQVWSKARPLMHLIAEFVDHWERFGNALSPTPPFPSCQPPLTLAACLLLLLVVSFFTSPYVAMKLMSFIFGFGFFGDPVITPAMALVGKEFPSWTAYLELKHTVLRGIPTNNQLVITLLRIGERNRAPLSPPPTSDLPPQVKSHATTGQNLDHLRWTAYPAVAQNLTQFQGVTDEVIDGMVQPDPTEKAKKGSPKKTRKSGRIFNLVKGMAKSGIQTAVAADRSMEADRSTAAAGAKYVRRRLGAVKGNKPCPSRGPVSFATRYKGEKGHAYITSTATTPAVSWTSNLDNVNPAWTVLIGEISELRKVAGLGWKSKVLVGWALGSEVVDGLMVKTKAGNEMHLTAVESRDNLFNRLIAIGSQVWEVW